MTIVFQELSDRRQARLAPNERVLWCGKGRPVAVHDGMFAACFAGLLLCALATALAVKVLPALGDSPSWQGFRIPAMLLFVAFLLAGLWLLLAPLRHWLVTCANVWAITDRRVIRFCGPFVRTWESERLLDEPEWYFLDDEADRDFAFGRHRRGLRLVVDCIESVPAADVPQVEAALLRLAELRRATRGSGRVNAS